MSLNVLSNYNEIDREVIFFKHIDLFINSSFNISNYGNYELSQAKLKGNMEYRAIPHQRGFIAVTFCCYVIMVPTGRE